VATVESANKPAQVILFEVTVSGLKTVFRCAHINEQMPILPNQAHKEQAGLLLRSITDLSVDMMAAQNQGEKINQSAADQRNFVDNSQYFSTPSVKEIKLWFPDATPKRPLMLVMLEDS